MRNEIDAIIFDLGGVLVSSPAALMASIAADHDLTIEQFLPIALGPLETDGDHPWHATERGELTLDQFAVAIEPLWRAAGYSSFPTPPPDIGQTLTAIPEMIDVARSVRDTGLRTAILTNNIAEWGGWREMVAADELVDVIVDSSDVGLRKPNPAIYTLTAERLGVAPDRCLFLDDFRWNLEAPRQLGMQVWHVTDPVETAARLQSEFGR